MKTFQSIDEILSFAINAEQQAVEFYTRLSEESSLEEMKKVFMDFAREEMSHKARLMNIQTERTFAFVDEAIPNLKISDYSPDVNVHPGMDYRETLLVAMNREKAAFRLYSRLAELAANPDHQNIFRSLAQEEAKHKLRFEIEYDDFVLREN